MHLLPIVKTFVRLFTICSIFIIRQPTSIVNRKKNRIVYNEKSALSHARLIVILRRRRSDIFAYAKVIFALCTSYGIFRNY